jgi:hypothetical protein
MRPATAAITDDAMLHPRSDLKGCPHWQPKPSGPYCRTKPTKHGLTRGYRIRTERVHGFQAGDTVRAEVQKGARKGVHVGRLAVGKEGQSTVGKVKTLVGNTAASSNQEMGMETTEPVCGRCALSPRPKDRGPSRNSIDFSAGVRGKFYRADARISLGVPRQAEWQAYLVTSEKRHAAVRAPKPAAKEEILEIAK